MKLRRVRFEGAVLKRRVLDREVDRLCKPREGDDKVLLIVGNAAKATSGFKGVRGQLRGPVNKLIQRVVERGKALVVFTSEFRTSKLDLEGELVVHPQETREKNLTPKPCRHHSSEDPQQRLTEATASTLT